jgi:hypothetical protein
VLVLLDLDPPRQALVRALQAARLTTLVLVVAADAPLRVRAGVAGLPVPDAVHAIAPGDAARVLAGLSGAPALARESAVA